MNVYAATISLLQNNCTFLNEKRQMTIDSKKYFDAQAIDFCTITSFTPAIISFALKYINITGYTGDIWFPEEGLVRAIKPFYLYNPTDNLIDAPLVGTLDIRGANINDSAINFVDGVAPCSSKIISKHRLVIVTFIGIVPQNPDLSYAVVAVFFGLSIVFLIFTAFMFVFFIYYRKHNELRKSAPIITLVMLAGVAGLAMAQLFSSFGKTDAICALVLYFYRLCSVLLFIGLLVKNYRIYRIFNNKCANSLVITEGKLLLAIGIVFILYAIWLTVIVVVLKYGAILKQSSKDEYYQYVACAVPNNSWNTIIEITLELTQLFPLIISLILAWFTRKIRAEYSESRELAAFATIVLAALIIFLPLNYTLTDESKSKILKYVLYVEYLTVAIVSALSILFVPKIYVLYMYNKKSKNIYK